MMLGFSYVHRHAKPGLLFELGNVENVCADLCRAVMMVVVVAAVAVAVAVPVPVPVAVALDSHEMPRDM